MVDLRITIKDVAKLANVSISTVSRVMNNPIAVQEEKRIRVQAAIEELNFEPNSFARGLINNRSHTIGVLIPDILNPYYSGVIRGMEDAAKSLDYALIICNTDRDEQRTLSYLHNFRNKHIDGILYTSDFMRPSYYKEIDQYHMPVVLVSTESKEYPLSSIMIDDEKGAFDAVTYLIALGHNNIAFLGFTLPDPITGEKRYRGFKRALREGNIYDQCKEYIAFANNWFEEAYRSVAQLMQKHPQITAIFACSDEFAMAAIAYLHDNNLQVPKNVSVVGFDNVRMSWMVTPRLTTIAQPMYDIGYKAVLLLHNQLTNVYNSPTQIILPHELVIRESTREVR